jgi:hypothetical protein
MHVRLAIPRFLVVFRLCMEGITYPSLNRASFERGAASFWPRRRVKEIHQHHRSNLSQYQNKSFTRLIPTANLKSKT